MAIHMEKASMKEKKGCMVLQAASFVRGLADAMVFAACPKLESLCCSDAQSQQLQNFASWKIGPAKGLLVAGPAKRATHVPDETCQEKKERCWKFTAC